VAGKESSIGNQIKGDEVQVVWGMLPGAKQVLEQCCHEWFKGSQTTKWPQLPSLLLMDVLVAWPKCS